MRQFRSAGRIAVAVLGGLVLAGCGATANGSSPTAQNQTLTIYSDLPCQGPDQARQESIVNGEKLALYQAGGHVGRVPHQLRLARRRRRQGRDVDAGGHAARGADGVPGHVDDRLHRRLGLRRVGDLPAAAQRDRRPPGQSGQHVRRTDRRLRRPTDGASPTGTTRPVGRGRSPGSSRPTRSRLGRWSPT